MLTYNKAVAGQIAASKAITYIVEILKTQQKEKIVRLCLSALVVRKKYWLIGIELLEYWIQ